MGLVVALRVATVWGLGSAIEVRGGLGARGAQKAPVETKVRHCFSFDESWPGRPAVNEAVPLGGS